MDVVTVDDSDLSLLEYSHNQWFLGGSSSEYNSTTHGSFSAGAKMTFKFNGTSVAVYGTISGTDPALQSTVPACNSTYQIDDASLSTYTAPFVSANLYQARYFQSPQLQAGPHTLVLTATCANQGPWFWLDYLTYVPSPVAAAVSVSASPSSVSSSPTPAATSPPATAPTAAGPSSGVLAAAITIPLSVALLLALSALWWLKRLRRQRGARALDLVLDIEDPPPQTPPLGISPFTAFPAVHTAPPGLHKALPPTPGEEKSTDSDARVTQHTDGGVRLEDGLETVGVELPPAYGRY
ncbi:hypothetical protein PHLGIDRAFT_428764 [Phlebiopsis gigantea 11061_1 CR5-6]|uniref:Uncharacterized protein n=1 Tax=Phlebiopsis gigantea (strain 11061_1 CR5-6) TaxID=745531 RepID=A0A0C3PL74_PHLG1|nr:hypothetical protein PHLGIDRAFT_428764 [Phlebiopsis gigantea 11061_1 CR5-6]